MFRPGVMLVFYQGGKVLVGKRINVHHGSWQFPQGGIDLGENPAEAAVREAQEEIGVKPGDFEIRAVLTEETSYTFPLDVQQRDGCIGQRHTWFLCKLKDPNQVLLPSNEFSDYDWVLPNEALTRVVGFKKEAYRKGLQQLEVLFEEI